jgi:hypothetical protein
MIKPHDSVTLCAMIHSSGSQYMPNAYQIYAPKNALINRLQNLPEMSKIICSQKHADVTYHLETEVFSDMGDEPDSDAGVTQILIEARLDSGKVVGRLAAYLFNMDKLGQMGLMNVFSHSKRTKELFKSMYQGNYKDCSDDYLFQPAFLEALKAQLSPETIEAQGYGDYQMDDYCMGYNIAYLDVLESLDSAYKECGDEMLGVLKGLEEWFDFLVTQQGT